MAPTNSDDPRPADAGIAAVARSTWTRVRAMTDTTRALVRRHVTDRAHAQEAMTDEQQWRRHQIRQIAVLVTLPAMVIGTGSIAAAWGSGLMDRSPTRVCEPVVVDAPAKDTFDVRVLNASGVAGVATRVGRDFGKRGFHVVVASSAPPELYVPGVANIYYGRAGLDQALLVAQQVDGAQLRDDGRSGTTVTLVLGDGFDTLVPVPPPDPPRPEQIHVNVWNTTYRAGLAAQVAQGLAARGFVIGGTGNDPRKSFLPDDVAVIRHGPDGSDAAAALAEHLTGARLVLDETREGTAVDLVLGNEYAALRPLADVPPPPPKKPEVRATIARPCT